LDEVFDVVGGGLDDGLFAIESSEDGVVWFYSDAAV
jgi:hypothetical protein